MSNINTSANIYEDHQFSVYRQLLKLVIAERVREEREMCALEAEQWGASAVARAIRARGSIEKVD